MDWRHEVNEEWALARKGCLTASDIVSLIPAFKTLKKKDPTFDRVLSPQFAGKIGEKCFAEVDVKSYGPAARGHVMEPYAVEEFNNLGIATNIRAMYHWDDVVIQKTNSPLAFSPDAMCLPQESKGEVHLMYRDKDKLLYTQGGKCVAPMAGAILEIKSYGAKHHAQCCVSGKKELDERWQIATAMAVCDNVREAYLMFYNPGKQLSKAVPQICVKKYTRGDLVNEVNACKDIADAYLHQCKLYGIKVRSGWACQLKTEEEIWEETQGALSFV